VADGHQLTEGQGGHRISPVLLDVTDSAHIAALADQLPSRLDAIVNNAGIIHRGPVEGIDVDDLRHQFDVNVVGQVAVTQALLPAIRAATGRIVFVSSVSGRISTPSMGAYCGTKFAVEGIVDALRIELVPWGIKTILVEPNATDTSMWRNAITALDSQEAAMTPEHRNLYAAHTAGMRKAIKPTQKNAVSVDHVARTIELALTSSRPKARYLVGFPSRLQIAMASLIPTPLMDSILARMVGLSRTSERTNRASVLLR
jgi:NAD(P)-dependent dehydrogenase (short-subunit alcohol dehydrogenase family)